MNKFQDAHSEMMRWFRYTTVVINHPIFCSESLETMLYSMHAMEQLYISLHDLLKVSLICLEATCCIRLEGVFFNLVVWYKCKVG